MDKADYSWKIWRRRKVLSLREAAWLMAGVIPTIEVHWLQDGSRELYESCLLLLLEAVERGSLRAKIKQHRCEPKNFREFSPDAMVDDIEFTPQDVIEASLIDHWIPCTCKTDAEVTVEQLTQFLRAESIDAPFFSESGPSSSSEFSNSTEAAVEQLASCRDYLDKNGPYYAPKLAAAVRAWEAVTAKFTKTSGLNPKEDLEAWIDSNAHKFWTKKNAQGHVMRHTAEAVSEAARTANWQPQGGRKPSIKRSRKPTFTKIPG